MTSSAPQPCDPFHLHEDTSKTLYPNAGFRHLANHLLKAYGQEITIQELADLAALECADDLTGDAEREYLKSLLQDLTVLKMAFTGSVLLRDVLAQMARGGQPSQPRVQLDDREAWQHVLQALGLIFAGLLIVFVAALTLATIAYLLLLGGERESAESRSTVLKIITVGNWIAALEGLTGGCFILIGQALCSIVPAASRANRWTSLSSLLIWSAPVVAIGVFLSAVGLQAEGFSSLSLAFLIPAGQTIVGHLVFVLALRRIGRFLNDKSVVRLGTAYLKAWTFLAVATAAFSLIPPANEAATTSRFAPEVYFEAVRSANRAQDHLMQLAVFGLPTVIGMAGLWIFLILVKKTRDAVMQALAVGIATEPTGTAGVL